MTDELRVEEEVATDDTGVDYVAAIKELKQNSVSKSDYAKLQEENKRLLQSLVNGETIQQTVEPVDVNKLRAELFGSENEYNNLEYMTKVMELRDTIIAQGGTDPFLPYGKNIAPTNEDISTANHVAEVIKDCMDYAEGDSQVFTNELQRRMIDTSPKRR